MAGKLGCYEAWMLLMVKSCIILAADTRRQSSADMAEDLSQCPAGISMLAFDGIRHVKY